MQTVDLLAKAPLFSNLRPKHLRRLADLAVVKSYPQGATIIKEGSPGLAMYVITSGRVEVVREENGRARHLRHLQPGEIVGELALVDSQARSATVRAKEPTECLLITRDVFQTLLRKDPEFSACIMQTLADRIREVSNCSSRTAAEVAASRTESRTEPIGPDPARSPDMASTSHEQDRHATSAGEPEAAEYNRSTGADHADTSQRDPMEEMVGLQTEVLRMGTDLLHIWAGMCGSLVGTVVGETNQALKKGLSEAVSSAAQAGERPDSRQ